MSAIGAPDYLQALERELADLAPDERVDLLEEVEASLLELEEDPVARLGPPARRSRSRASWRRSGGRCARSWSSPGSPCWRRRTARSRSRTTTPACSSARPARAGAGGLCRDRAAAGASRCAEAGSRSTSRSSRSWFPLAGILLDELRWDTQRVVYTVPYPPAPDGLARDGQSIRNVYPYDRKGRLLRDVRLFDEDGRPLDVLRGAYNPQRATVMTRSGAELFNAFPIRYFDSRTGRVENPDAAPVALQPPALVNSRRPSSP